MTATTTPAQANPAFKTEPLTIRSGSATHNFTVELALTDEQQRLGLMFRSQLAADKGMLFIHRPAQEVTMWMRNTKLSLDMIFIKSDGRIHRIAEFTEPFSLKTIASQGNVVAVLEVIAGTAKRLGLKPGDLVLSRSLGTVK